MKKTNTKIISLFLSVALILVSFNISVFAATSSENSTPFAVELTADNASPQIFEEIRLTANASGGAGSYNYKFNVENIGTGGKDYIQDTSQSNSCVWMGGSVDKRIMTVIATDAEGAVATDTLTIDVVPANGKLELELTASNSNPNTFEAINLTTAAKGGSGDYTYKFEVENLGTGGQDTIQEASDENSCTWMGGSVDTRIITATVQDSYGNKAMDTIAINVRSGGDDLNVSVNADNLSPLVFESTNVTATASGGNENYTYNFIVKNIATGGKSVIQDTSASNECPWMGGTSDIRYIAVTVFDTDGKKATSAVEINVQCEELDVALSTNNAAPIPFESIMLEAQATGGSGAYSYKFNVENLGTGGKSVIQDMSYNNSCTWMAGTVDKRIITVIATDEKGNTASKTLLIDVKGVDISVSLSADNTSPYVFEAIELTASASGGYGGYEYEFTVENLGTGGKDTIQDTSSKSSCTWRGGTADKRIITVTAKDSYGNAGTKAIEIDVQKIDNDALSVSLTADYTSPFVFQTIALTANASGGSGDYTYKFNVENLGTGGKDTIQDTSSKNSCTWRGGTADKRIITVIATDSMGKTATQTIEINVIYLNATGIDLSYHNGVVDWDKVKADGIGYAMLRTGFGRYLTNPESGANQIDVKFEYNYTNAKRVGIPVGVYHFTYATDAAGALEEAKACVAILEKYGVKPSDLAFPVTYDIEESDKENSIKDPARRQVNTDMVNAFTSYVKSKGYKTMVYADRSFMTTCLDITQLNVDGIWMAAYTSEPGNPFPIHMWQYTSSGRVDGITGNDGKVDLNYCYSADFSGNPSYVSSDKYNGIVYDVSSVMNVRSAPNTSSSIVARLPNATRVRIIESASDKWWKIETQDGTIGYAHKDYVKYI